MLFHQQEVNLLKLLIRFPYLEGIRTMYKKIGIHTSCYFFVLINTHNQWNTVVKQRVRFHRADGLGYRTKEHCPEKFWQRVKKIRMYYELRQLKSPTKVFRLAKKVGT